MGCLSKGLASILIITVAISCLTLLTVKPAFAQSIPTPSVPEFSVTYVPSTYSLVSADQYTPNETNTYTNNTIEFVIKNQPFSPIELANGTALNLYYSIEEKGHFSDLWNDYSAWDFYPATDSNYTVIYVEFGGDNGTEMGSLLSLNGVPAGGQVDFQIQASIGYFTTIVSNSPVGLPYYTEFTGESSGWSNTQTITISASSTSSSPTPTLSPTATPTPTVLELSWLAVIPLLLSVFSVAVIVRHRKTIS